MFLEGNIRPYKHFLNSKIYSISVFIVPYFKNLQKYADFWIAGTVKYPKLVETAVDSLADLVNNYILIFKQFRRPNI